MKLKHLARLRRYLVLTILPREEPYTYHDIVEELCSELKNLYGVGNCLTYNIREGETYDVVAYGKLEYSYAWEGVTPKYVKNVKSKIHSVVKQLAKANIPLFVFDFDSRHASAIVVYVFARHEKAEALPP